MENTTQHNKWTVYVHINKVNGKRYVGITSLDVNDRWRNGDGTAIRHMYLDDLLPNTDGIILSIEYWSP